MKKLFLFSIITLLAGCADLMSFSGADVSSSAQSKMNACLMSEAQSRFQAGTLFNDTVSATAKSMVGTCMKKLALQSVGISEESQSTAESIITNLKNLSAN